MRSVKGPALLVLLGAAIFVLPFKGPVALIKIPKVPGPVEPQLVRLQVDVRQELGSCYLALADGGALARLRQARVRFAVLDPAAGKRDILVVRLDSAGAIDALRTRGKAVTVEPGAAAFWTETGPSAEAVPPDMARKALPARSILPFIRPAAVTPRPAPRAALLDPIVDAIVSLVSTSNLTATVQALQDFQTRHTNTSGCRMAGDYLLGAFTALGLENVGFEVFGALPGSRNVVGQKTGATFPDDILIICAHYDSTSSSAATLAPGADDNASGTAAVVEAARILATVPLDFTVRFIAFSGEEQGLYGSRAHASGAFSRGERIVGVINLDMIAYSSVLPESMEIYVNGFSDWLGARLLDASSSYGGPAGIKRIDPSMVYSDHSPFWDNGYAALLAIEADFNPYYHQTSDTLDKLNPGYFTHVTRASLGLLAELAQPLREGYPRAPLGLVTDIVVYNSLFSSLKTLRLRWSPQSDAAGYNVYRSNMSHLDYLKLNTSPLSAPSFSDADIRLDETYYYVVTAVGTAGLESNRSVEVIIVGDTLGAGARLPGPFFLRFAGVR